MQGKLRGLVGQQMGGPKAPVGALVSLVSKIAPGSYTLGPFDFPVLIDAFLWGGGGGGNGVGISAGVGGSGAGAASASFALSAGQTTTCVVAAGGGVAAPGGETTLAKPNGIVVRATGGAANAGAPGIGVNGDVNRSGGVGGNTGAGSSGEFGGTGGGASSGGGGGGGAAGFSDLGDYPLGHGGQYVGRGVVPGGGAGSAPSITGADGQLLAIIRRL